MPMQPAQPRILFISLTNIGDVIISTVLLNRLLEDYPNAVVDVVVGEKSTSLFEGFPNLGVLHGVKKRKHSMHHVETWKKFIGTKYDVIVDLRTPFLGRLLRGKKKIIYKKVDDGTRRAEQIGRLWPSKKPLKQSIYVSDAVKKHVANQVDKTKPLVMLGPTANWHGKRWPQKCFAELVKELEKIPQLKGANYAICGAPWEEKTILDLWASLPKNRRINLMNTSLPEIAAWMPYASLFVGHDSGIGHIAAAADVPMVVLFGPMCEKKYAPLCTRGTIVVPPMRDWSEVNQYPVLHPRLITDITVPNVLDAVNKVLQPKRKEK